MNSDDPVPFIDVDDSGDLDDVLAGRARATSELVDAVDAQLCAGAETVEDVVEALSYVAALHLASTDWSEWHAVEQLIAGGVMAVDDIGSRVERALDGDNSDVVAAASAEALALVLLSRLPEQQWDDLSPEFVHLLGVAVVAGSRARPLRCLPWVLLAVDLLVTRPASAGEFVRDDVGVQLVQLVADAASRSARRFDDPALYATAIEAVKATMADADRVGLGQGHRRRLARDCVTLVRSGGSPELLETAVQAAREGAASADDVAAQVDFRDVEARAHSLRADIFGGERAEGDRRAAVDLWTDAVRAADEAGELLLSVRLRINLASELGLLAKLTGEESLVRRSIEIYESAGRDATTAAEQALVVSGLSNRYRQLYDLTSLKAHLDTSIELGERGIDGVVDDHARSVALNNQAARFRRRFEDFGRPGDIDAAIALSDEAVALIAQSRIERPKWLANLSHHYRIRAELNGDPADVDAARRYAGEALASAPNIDDIALDAYISAELMDPALTLDGLDDLLELAEQTAGRSGSPAQAALRVASVAHLRARRFEASGSIDDAELAAQAWDSALEFSPADHVDHVGMLTQAGAGAELLYEASGDASWLLRAIERHGEAVRLAESRQLAGPVIAVINVNLANSLARHGMLVLSSAELDRAVAAAVRAVDAAGVSQAEAAHTALGGALLSRHELRAEQEGRALASDGRRAISEYRLAHAAARTERSRRAAAGNVANALFHVGFTFGDLDLLNESTDWYLQATADAPPGDAAAAIRLTNLGFAAITVAGSEPDPSAREQQLEVARRAFDDAGRTAGSVVDLRVALGRARTAAASGQWGEAAVASEDAAGLFRGAAPSFNGGRYAQATLRLGAPLAAIGALAHVRAGEAAAAVRHLERTRATLLRAEVVNGSVVADALDANSRGEEAARLRSLVARARAIDARISDDAKDVDMVSLRLLRAEIELAVTAVGASLVGSDLELDPDESAAVAFAASGTPVAYLIGDDHGGAIVVVNDDGSIVAFDEPALATRSAAREAKSLRRLMLDLASPVAQHRFRTQLGNMCRHLGAEIGSRLVEIAGASGRLALVPVGPLAGIPWHAIDVDGDPLLRHVEVLYEPSAALGVAATRRGGPDSDRCCNVSFVEDDGWPWTMEAEGRAVAQQWRERGMDVEEIVGDAASVARVEQALASSAVAHVAAHAFERQLVSESGIALADGVLSARRMLAVGAPAELLFLAACSTGRALLEEEEQFTLAAVGLAAGSATVVSTLWPVPDVAGAVVAERFYERWLRGDPPSRALRSAQLSLLDGGEFADEFFWAPYTATGA